MIRKKWIRLFPLADTSPSFKKKKKKHSCNVYLEEHTKKNELKLISKEEIYIPSSAFVSAEVSWIRRRAKQTIATSPRIIGAKLPEPQRSSNGSLNRKGSTNNTLTNTTNILFSSMLVNALKLKDLFQGMGKSKWRLKNYGVHKVDQPGQANVITGWVLKSLP